MAVISKKTTAKRKSYPLSPLLRVIVTIAILFPPPIPRTYAGDFDITTAGYLGDASDDDEVVGVAIQSDGDVVLAAQAGPQTPSLVDASRLNGATEDSKGVVMVLSPDGKQVKSCARVAERIYDLTIDASDNIYLATGTQALALDPNGTTLRWSVDAPRNPKNNAQLALLHRIDANDGIVAILAGAYGVTSLETLNSAAGTGQILVCNATTGTLTARFSTMSGRNAMDITVDPVTHTIVLVGWRQANDWWISGSLGGPVQIPLIVGYTYSGTVRWVGYDWSVTPSELATYLNRNGLFPDGTKTPNATTQNNMADSRLYRVALGQDGAIVATGHSAGGNHPYRYQATNLLDTTESAYPCIKDDIGPHGFSVRAKTNENGKAYFVILPDGAAAPDATQVKEGKDKNGNLVAENCRGSIDLVAGVVGVSSEVTALNASTNYDVFVVAEDDAGNLTPVKKLDVKTDSLRWTDTSDAAGARAWIRESSSSTTFRAALTAPGRVWWVVVPGGASAPTPQQVKEGKDANNNAIPAERKGSFQCTTRGVSVSTTINVPASSAWDFYAITEDANGILAGQDKDDGGNVIPTAKLPAVTTAPTLKNGGTENAFNSGFTSKIETDRQCTAWYVVVANNAGAPNATQVKEGKNNTGNPAIQAGSVSGNGVLRATVTGLFANTDYDVYWTAEGFATGLLTTPVKIDSKTANDTTPPVWDGASPPSIVETYTDGVRMSVKVDEKSTVYWVRLPADATVPTAAQVKEGKDATGGNLPAAAYGNFIATANTQTSATISNLTSGTSYRLALVAENLSGLLQGAAVKLDFETLSVVSSSDWVTPPTISSIGVTSATLRFKNTDGGTGYWLVQPAGSPAPTLNQVKTSGNSVSFSWKLPAIVALRNLSAGTAYDVWVVATNPNGQNIGPTRATFTTATAGSDTTPPTWQSATLSNYDLFCSYAGASSQHLAFAARFDISQGYPIFVGGQGVVARLDAVTPNSLHCQGGGVAGGSTGRLFLAGISAYGLPFWPNSVWTPRTTMGTTEIGYNPFGFSDYTGGAFLVVLDWGSTNLNNPNEKWFNKRAYTTRLAFGASRAVAVRKIGQSDHIVWGGAITLEDGPMYVVGEPFQKQTGYGAADGFFVIHIPGQNNDIKSSSTVVEMATPIPGPTKTSDGSSISVKIRDTDPSRVNGLDLDGNPSTTDARFQYVWSTTSPLTPASGGSGTGAWTYTGIPIYGGITIDVAGVVDTPSAHTVDTYTFSAEGSDKHLRLTIKDSVPTNNAEKLRSWAAFYMNTADMKDANGNPIQGANDRLSFDTDSAFSITLQKGNNNKWLDLYKADGSAAEPPVDLDVRFLVRNGTTWYISKEVQHWKGKGTSEFSYNTLTFTSDSNDGEWAVWTPTENDTLAAFNASTATFSSQDFQDITAIGVYMQDNGWRIYYKGGTAWDSPVNSNAVYYRCDGFTASFAKNARTNLPPVASFVITENSLTANDAIVLCNDPVTVNASASSDPDGQVAFISWNFGDGYESSGVVESHAYTAAGRYPITVKVWDDGRLTTTLTKYVNVVRGDVDQNTAAATVACWFGCPVEKGDFQRPADATYITTPIDLDSDGSNDDYLLHRPYAEITTPLSLSTWKGTRLFGGWRAERRDSTSAGAIDKPGILECGNNSQDVTPWTVHGVFLRSFGHAFTGGATARVYGLYAIDKSDFLHGNHDSTVKVTFNENSLLRAGPVHTMPNDNKVRVRFAVRDGNQWYASEYGYTANQNYSITVPTNRGYANNPVIQLANPGAANWVAFNPAMSMNPPDSGFATHTFTDITAVGVIFEVDDNGNFFTLGSGSHYGIRLAGLEFQATSDLASKPAPVASFTASPTTGNAPLTVTVDASGSTGGLARTYTWDFGDGVITSPSTSPTATHDYTRDGNYAIRLTVTDSIGRTSTASQNVTVGTPPTITMDTTSITVNEGDEASINLTRSGSSAGTVSVRYRTVAGSAKADNSGATPAGQGPDYEETDLRCSWGSGEVGTKTVKIRTLTDSINESNESFTVEISDPYGGAVINGGTSKTITIQNVPAAAPTITTHPSSISVAEDDTVKLTVVATGSELTYAWYKGSVAPANKLSDNNRFSQTTTPELKIKNIKPADDGNYICVVSNLAGNATSNPATVTVNDRPNLTITSPSIERVVLPDHQDSLILVATAQDPENAPLTYAWTQVLGPVSRNAVFSDPTAAATRVSFPATGTYVLRCTVSDGVLSASDEVTVIVDAVWQGNVVGPIQTTNSTPPVNVTGSGSFADGVGTIRSSWTQRPDGLNGFFIRTPHGGDFSVTVCMNSTANVSNTNWAYWGILATQHSNVTTSPFAFMGQYTGQGPVAMFRGSEGGAISSTRTGSGPWIRLTRVGDLFTGYRSTDGVTWTQQMSSQMISMQDPILLGILLNAHNDQASISAADAAKIMTVTFSNVTGLPDVNNAPNVDAGLSARVPVNVTLALGGNATDDGKPSGSTLTTTWTKVSGPGTVTLSNASSPASNATFSAAGTYLLRLSASDSAAESCHEKTVVVGGVSVGTISGPTSESGDTATFSVALLAQPTANVTISVTSSNTNEGTVSPSTLTFTPTNWSTSQNVTVTGVDDTNQDGNQVYTISMSASSTDPAYQNIAIPSVNVTNIDNDSASITVTPTSGLVTTESGGNATFTVRLNTMPSAEVTIPLSSSNPGEGTVFPTTLYFGPTASGSGNGTSSADRAAWNTPVTVIVTGVDDSQIDGDVSYMIITGEVASSDLNYDALTASDVPDVSVTNLDDDTAGTIRMVSATASVSESVASGKVVIEVERVGGKAGSVSIDFATQNGSALAGSDYTAVSGNLTWANNESGPKTLEVPILDDTLTEGDENFSVVLSYPSGGATLDSGRAATVVSILDNDSLPVANVTAESPNIPEGGSSAFRITLDHASASDLTVNFSISGTATAGSDYNAIASTSVTFTASEMVQGVLTKTVGVSALQDGAVEGSETVILTLQNGNGYTVAPSPNHSATITITDGVVVSVTASDPNASETVAGAAPNTGTFTISLSHAGSNNVTVHFSIGGSASPGNDYAAISTDPLVFTVAEMAAGTLSKTVTMTPVDDEVVEGDETVILTLVSTSGARIGTSSSATVTITDNDTPPSATVTTGDATAAETVSGAVQNLGSFTIMLSPAPSSSLTVTYTLGGTAAIGSDYTVNPSGSSVTFAAGQTSKTVTINPVDDAIYEGNETVTLTLNPGTGYTLGGASSAVVTVVDNETAPVAKPPVALLQATVVNTNRAITSALIEAQSLGYTAPLINFVVTQGVQPIWYNPAVVPVIPTVVTQGVQPVWYNPAVPPPLVNTTVTRGVEPIMPVRPPQPILRPPVIQPLNRRPVIVTPGRR